MDASTLRTFESSLERCSREPEFLDRFYRIFLACSPKIQEKFANVDFDRQKRALRHSFDAMLMAATDGNPAMYLRDVAERHSSRDLNIGAEFYDYWIDSLLAAVRQSDPEFTPAVGEAWERVMMVGVHYLLSQY